MFPSLLQISVIVLLFVNTSFACKGCVSLDEHNLHKIVPHFKAVVAKFDQAYPYGDKHDMYVKFAEENKASEDLLFAEIPVKDYGEKTNFNLAQKYKLDPKKDLPVLMLFQKDIHTPLKMKKDFTIENMRAFVKDNTKLYLSLPGCVEDYDLIATMFVNAKTEDRKKVVANMEKQVKNALTQNLESAKIYHIYMKKIVENGMGFIQTETNRLTKILKDAKLTESKKEDMTKKINILHAFNTPNKDEL